MIRNLASNPLDFLPMISIFSACNSSQDRIVEPSGDRINMIEMVLND
jgi:hypothetical protein